MPRKDASRRLIIDEKICEALEARMETLRRREDLSRFVEWVLDLYVSGYLEESASYKTDISDAEDDAHLQMWLRDHPEARDKDGGLRIAPPPKPQTSAEVSATTVRKLPKDEISAAKPVLETKIEKLLKKKNEHRKAS